MNDRSKRVHEEWKRYLTAGPQPDDPFWVLVAEQEKVLDREVEKRRPSPLFDPQFGFAGPGPDTLIQTKHSAESVSE